MYQAGSWEYPRRVVFKIEKPYGELTHMHTFKFTNMDMEPYQIIKFYRNRGRMENSIKEGKSSPFNKIYNIQTVQRLSL